MAGDKSECGIAFLESLFYLYRSENGTGLGLFVCLSILGTLGGGRPSEEQITAGSFERNPQPETPPFLCPRAPRPPSAAALSGRPSRRVWAVGCVGAARWRFGHSPCPATHAHTLLHALHFRYTHSSPRRLLHTPTRTPYATHLPVDSAPVRPPRQQ